MKKSIVVVYKDSEDSTETHREVVFADCFYTAMKEVLNSHPNAFIVCEG